MKKATLVITLVVLMSVFYLGFTILPDEVMGITLYVGGPGPGNYTTIQDAIDAATPGDTIFVFNGVYHENVQVNKSISLIGEDRDNTIVNGSNAGDVFNITADWVSLTGFTVKYGSGGWLGAGIELSLVTDCKVSNNSIQHSKHGIILWASSDNTVTNNTFSNNEDGVYFRASENNTVTYNEVLNAYLFSFWLEDSHSNIIANNTVSSEHDGISLYGSDSNDIKDNLVFSNRSTGIVIRGSENNTVVNNTINANTNGFNLRGSDNNTLANNNVSTKRGDSVYIHSSRRITMVDNTMIGSGIYMEGSLEHWNTHSIDNSNTVNGKSVQYWKNIVGGTIPPGAGQIILANCSGVIAENQNVSNGSVGFLVGYSSFNTIANSSSSGNRREGLNLIFSDNNTIIDGNFSENSKYGIYLFNSAHNIVSDNSVFSNDIFGIYPHVSTDTVTRNAVAWNKRGIYVGSSSNCTISHNNVSWNSEDGIHVSHADNSTIVNNTVFSNVKHGIYVESSRSVLLNNTVLSNRYYGIAARYSSNNILIGNVVQKNREIGISIYHSDNNTVKNNQVSGHSRSGIGFSYSRDDIITDNNLTDNSYGLSYGGSNSTITNNSAFGNGYGITVGGENNTVKGNWANGNEYGISIGPAWDSVVEKNDASLNSIDGIRVRGLNSNVIISNNNASLNQRHGIYLAGWRITLTNNTMLEDGIYIESDYLSGWNLHTIDTSNTVNGKPVYYWKDCVGGTVPAGAGQIILANCTGVLVHNQNSSFSSAGILVGFSSNNTIANNTFSWNTREGLALYFSDNNTISSNNVSWNAEKGIYLRGSASNTIARSNFSNNNDGIFASYDTIENTVANNTISRNNRYGIYSYPSYNIVIERNTISGNQDGICLRSSSSGRIEENTVSYNSGYGIFLYNSYNTSVNHNNFVENKQQAWDNEDTIRWDNGYPSGGNYWSDYTGTDWYSGPNQDQPGSDSLGDTPYVIDSDSQDRYPLLAPFGTVLPRPPTLIRANLSGLNFGNVTVIWALSPDDGMGSSSVIGYQVYRNTTHNSEGLAYQLFASVPNGTSEYTDTSVGEGDPNNYFYRVCAVDAVNGTRCTRDQAAKFVRPLTMGLNIISAPIYQYDEELTTVLQTVSFDNSWFYDSYDQRWRSLMKSKTYDPTITYFNRTMSLWTNVTRSSNFTVAGLVPWSTGIYLKTGWNLVGFPSFNTTYTIGDLKAQTGAARVEGFDPLSSPYFLKELGNSEIMKPGYGYWVWVDADITWTVPGF